MFNFFLGAPRLFSNLFHQISNSASLATLPGPYIFPKADYRKQIRLEMQKRRTAIDIEAESSVLRPELDRLYGWHETIILSQPAFLGTHAEVCTSSLKSSRTRSRVAKLSSFFEDRALAIHFAIMPQFIYMRVAKHANAYRSREVTDPFAWRHIVKEISEAAPNRTIFVWDLTHPTDIALNLTSRMLGVAQDELGEDIVRITRKYTSRYRSLQEEEVNSLSQLEMLEYHKQYTGDIDSIRAMKNVVLMGSSAPLD